MMLGREEFYQDCSSKDKFNKYCKSCVLNKLNLCCSQELDSKTIPILDKLGFYCKSCVLDTSAKCKTIKKGS